MESNNTPIKPLAYGAVIFITLGITIANETLSRFGLEGNFVFAFSIAFLCAAFLLKSKAWLTLLVIVGVLVINLPAGFHQNYNLDVDVLLACICGLILVPSVYDLIIR